MSNRERRRWTIVSAGLLLGPLLLLGCTRAETMPPTPAPPSTGDAKPSASPNEPTPTDPLTGGKKSDREVFAVKIENTAAARPQLGLNQADIVVVEEVEAGITRLIGVFHTRFPSKIGPVRSARNTDAQLLPMFGKPGLVYSGANSRVQAQIAKASVVAIERSDRDNSRQAPHNVMVDLKGLAKRYKAGKAQDIGLNFDETAPAAATKAGSAKARIGNDTFTFGYSSKGYLPKWNGASYGTGKTAARADNVVILQVKNRRDTQSTSNISVVSQTVGKGKVQVYRDGRKVPGTWSRKNSESKLKLRSEGKDIALAPGKTWIVLQGT